MRLYHLFHRYTHHHRTSTKHAQSPHTTITGEEEEEEGHYPADLELGLDRIATIAHVRYIDAERAQLLQETSACEAKLWIIVLGAGYMLILLSFVCNP